MTHRPGYYKEYRQKNPEKVKKWEKISNARRKDAKKAWYEANKGKQLALGHVYYQLHKEEHNKSVMNWQAKNPVKVKEMAKKYRQKFQLQERHRNFRYYMSTKEALFDILGWQCATCGFADVRALQFDHINGGGNKERKEFKHTAKMYRYYVRNPELARNTLQVLCANCNWIKKHEKNENSKRKQMFFPIMLYKP